MTSASFKAGYPYDGPISIALVRPGSTTPAATTALGIFVGDGPTNDTTVRFYDLGGNVLGSLSADPSADMFLRWSDPSGVSRMELTNGAGDDYYVDNLTSNSLIGPAVPAPGAILLGTIGAGLLSWLRQDRRI